MIRANRFARIDSRESRCESPVPLRSRQPLASLPVHGLHFTVYAPSRKLGSSDPNLAMLEMSGGFVKGVPA